MTRAEQIKAEMERAWKMDLDENTKAYVLNGLVKELEMEIKGPELRAEVPGQVFVAYDEEGNEKGKIVKQKNGSFKIAGRKEVYESLTEAARSI